MVASYTKSEMMSLKSCRILILKSGNTVSNPDAEFCLC